MNQTTSFILGVFPILVGILIFVISSNVYAYAQQQLSPSPAADSSSDSNSTSVSNTISPELKAKMCDPSSPSLKVVNTTESRICGIPKTVKPHSLSPAVTPPTSAAVSLPPQQQTTITKPAAAAAASADSAPPPKQQQQIATTNNNNASLLPTGGATRATIAPVSNPSNKSLSSSLSQSPSAIVPQIKAVNQQHKQHQLAPPITLINGTKKGTNSTAGQNYTFAASSPAATSDKPLYLGYHDTTTTTTSSAHSNSGSKHNDNTDSKHHTPRSARSTSDDNSSEGKDTTKRFNIPHIKIATPDIGSTATKKKAVTDTKPFTPFYPIRIPLPGNDFTEKKTTTTTHSTKLSTSDSTDEDPKVGVSPTNHHHSRSVVDKSSSIHTKPPFFPPPHIIVNTKEHSSDTKSSIHTDFSRGLLSSSPSPSDLGLDIRSKVDSFIRNSLGGVRHGLFG